MIDAKEVYEKIYKIIGDKTPLKIDCGKLCGSACCIGEDDESGMYLFPKEEIMYNKTDSFIKIYDSDFTYDNITSKIAICEGSCDRGKRPLACRIFPLTPYFNTDGEFSVRIDNRARGMCPLAYSLDKEELDKSFVKRVTKAMRLLMLVNDPRSFVKSLSRLIDEQTML